MFSVAYIGNVSRDLPNNGGYLSNINMVPQGAMLGSLDAMGNVYSGLANPNPYRPYPGYSDMNQVGNFIYSNYNGLQVKWAHQSRSALIQLNYTWSHYLGIVGNGTTLGGYGATTNPFSMRANYSALPADRRQIFNAAYNFNLPSPIHGNRIASGFVNGWQISGTTGIESGANLTGYAGGYNFNMNMNGAIVPGSANPNDPTLVKGNPINSQSIYGTPNPQLEPILTCDPRSNLGSHQYINGSCFAAPTTPGVVALPSLPPPIYGPSYFNSDLGIFKNFQIGSREASRLQIRAEASNFLNHPLWSFPQNNLLTLNFKQDPNTGAVNMDTQNFGTTLYKQGLRIVEFSAKYYF